jgi:hypothetical protein
LDVSAVYPNGDHALLRSGGGKLATNCIVYPDGSLTMALLSMEPRRQEREPAITPLAPAEESPRIPESVPSQGAEQANRVVLTGRLGRAVSLRTTARGKTIGRVPLAVHLGEKTEWHTVLFFDDAANRAAAELSKGQMLTVIGYRHSREVTDRDGGTRQVEEIYAASVQLAKLQS